MTVVEENWRSDGLAADTRKFRETQELVDAVNDRRGRSGRREGSAWARRPVRVAPVIEWRLRRVECGGTKFPPLSLSQTLTLFLLPLAALFQWARSYGVLSARTPVMSRSANEYAQRAGTAVDWTREDCWNQRGRPCGDKLPAGGTACGDEGRVKRASAWHEARLARREGERVLRRGSSFFLSFFLAPREVDLGRGGMWRTSQSERQWASGLSRDAVGEVECGGGKKGGSWWTGHEASSGQGHAR